jgi:hypothetical protein
MMLIHFKSYKPLKLAKNGILEKIRVIVYVFLAPGRRIHNSWFAAGMHNFYVFLPPGRTIFTCFCRREGQFLRVLAAGNSGWVWSDPSLQSAAWAPRPAGTCTE